MHDKGSLRTGLVPVRVGAAEIAQTLMQGRQWRPVAVFGFRFVQVLKYLHAKASTLKLVTTSSLFEGRREGPV